jgi:hypothetical protein
MEGVDDMSSTHEDKHQHTAPPDDSPEGEVEHTPIIVSDGSASIQFHLPFYPLDSSTGVNSSKNLFLQHVEAKHKAHADGKAVCHELDPGEECVIVVTCKQQGKTDEQYVIRGGNSTDPAMSPSIKFNHSEFKEDPINFPPETFPGLKPGNRFVNKDRNPTKLEIFRVEADGSLTSVHDCPLVSDPHAKYVILDADITE